MRIRFGTDGWRGVIARDFTFANVRRVAAALAAYLEESGGAARGVAVAYDRRFLSGAFAGEVVGVLAARGIPALLAPEALPTPVVSWAVREQGLAGGVVITASHNPPEWNGVKFKEPFGGSARVGVNRRIEELLRRDADSGEPACLSLEAARSRGLLTELDAWRGYREGLARLVDFDLIRRAGLSLVVDPMYGSGTPWLRRFLEEAGCRVDELHGDANPGFGGLAPEPVEASLGELLGRVARCGCLLGLATDGDADRIGAVDERGHYFSPQRILAVFAKYLYEVKGLRGDIVKTVSATSMLDLLAARYGLAVTTTPIGFKHVGEAMAERQVLVGGEESGGIGVAAHLPERDGLLNALLLTEIVARTGGGLRAYLEEIFAAIGYFTYRRVDLRLAGRDPGQLAARLEQVVPPARLAGAAVREVSRLDGLRFLLDDHAWLLVRPSGTEPVVRVYAEGRSAAQVSELLEAGRRMVTS